VNIGTWVLRTLFLGFIREELRTRRKRDNNASFDSVLQLNLSSPTESNSSNGHRRSFSDPATASLSRGAVVASPKMVPAVIPVIPSIVRASPLVAPMISLQHVSKDMHHLPSIPQSPLPNMNSNDITPMPRHLRSQSTDSGQQTTLSLSTSPAKEGDYFSVRVRQPSGSSKTPDELSAVSNAATPSRQSSIHEPGHVQTPVTPGGFMGRLKSFGKTASKKIGGDAANTPALPGASATDSSAIGEVIHFSLTGETLLIYFIQQSPTPGAAKPKTPVQLVLSGPLSPPPSTECPTISPPREFPMILSEEASPNWVTIYRGHTSSTSRDLRSLEEAIPMWLMEFLLTNKSPPVAVNKISFVMLPWPSKDHDREPLPELLNT
jgi:WD repeat-containing protein 48